MITSRHPFIVFLEQVVFKIYERINTFLSGNERRHHEREKLKTETQKGLQWEGEKMIKEKDMICKREKERKRYKQKKMCFSRDLNTKHSNYRNICKPNKFLSGFFQFK
jgi:tRNA G10  N-methylase Trm11